MGGGSRYSGDARAVHIAHRERNPALMSDVVLSAVPEHANGTNGGPPVRSPRISLGFPYTVASLPRSR